MDLSRLEWRAGFDQLISRRNRRDFYPGVDADLGHTHGRQHADLRRANQAPCLQHRFTRPHTLTGRPHVVAGGRIEVQDNLALSFSDDFDGDNGGRADRHGRAGHDAYGLPRPRRRKVWRTGRNLTCNPQCAALTHVVGLDREAVHGRVGKGRDVPRRHHVLGQYGPAGVQQLDGHGWQRPKS